MLTLGRVHLGHLDLCNQCLKKRIKIENITPLRTLTFFPFFTELVTFVTLFPTTITAIAEQQINLTCVTSYCIPSANITWHWSSTDISNYSTSKTNENGSLIMTESTLIKTVGKRDNGDHVYCKASNIQGENVVSVERLVNVLCK